jgi:hypothetical protein
MQLPIQTPSIVTNTSDNTIRNICLRLQYISFRILYVEFVKLGKNSVKMIIAKNWHYYIMIWFCKIAIEKYSFISCFVEVVSVVFKHSRFKLCG